jgi:hypothetical protein
MLNPYIVIRLAIQDKRQVRGWYRGHFRAFCPHALGTKNGKRQALVYQFEGSGSGGPVTGGWRCLRIDRLTDVSLAPGEWCSGPTYHGASTCLDHVEFEVDKPRSRFGDRDRSAEEEEHPLLAG